MGEIFERPIPKVPLEWTGERLTTAVGGQVEIEHLHRYFLARDLCRGLDVLDVASGEGYGTALLAQVARSVVGVDISAEAVAHAAEAYCGQNFRFLEGDARSLPLEDASVDAVVSFETIEHLCEHDQFLAEVHRVLRPGGCFIVSSPERDSYSPSGAAANPHHVHELTRAEFGALIGKSFAHVRILGQRPMLGSALVPEEDGQGRPIVFEKRGPRHFEASVGLARPVYLIAVASDRPIADLADSFYISTAEIGAILTAASVTEAATAELASLRTRANVAESAHAAARSELALSIQQANEQAASYRRELLALDQASTEHAARACALEAALKESRAGEAVARGEFALSIQQTSEQAASYRQELLVVGEASRDQAARVCALEAALTESRAREAAQQADAETARAEIDAARAEAAAACLQRDIARTAALRTAAAAEGQWRGRIAELEQHATETEKQAAEWRGRIAELEQHATETEKQAAEWRLEYEGVRRRVDAFLRRFIFLRALRLIPAWRRFVREQLLGERK